MPLDETPEPKVECVENCMHDSGIVGRSLQPEAKYETTCPPGWRFVAGYISESPTVASAVIFHPATCISDIPKGSE